MPFDPTDPDTKAALKEAIADATEGLIAKRDELLGEVKKLKKGQQVDPADVEKLEGERDQLRTQLSEATKAAKKSETAAAEATKKLADADARETRLLVDNGLNEALAKAGVTNPALAKAAKALLASQALIVTDGDSRVVKIGDKSLADSISEWAGSDEGKNFVTAPNNSGGGSQGGQNNGGGAAKTITRMAFNGLDPVAQSAHFKDGGVVTD